MTTRSVRRQTRIVSHLLQTDAPERLPVDTGRLYQEALRPQFHFTARQWGMNRLNPGRQQDSPLGQPGPVHCL